MFAEIVSIQVIKYNITQMLSYKDASFTTLYTMFNKVKKNTI